MGFLLKISETKVKDSPLKNTAGLVFLPDGQSVNTL
jgi:hypothetical protein